MWKDSLSTTGGGVTLRRVGFLRMDLACSDKSLILRGGLAHYRLDKSLRPPLENKGDRSPLGDVSLESSDLLKKPASASPCTASLVFSSTILESQNSDTKQATNKNARNSFCERLRLESTFSNNAHSPSLRALAQDKAQQSIHSTHSKPAESKRYKLYASTYSLHTFLESTFEKADSNTATTLKQSAQDSRRVANGF